MEREKVFRAIVDGLRKLYHYDSVAIHLLSKDKKRAIITGFSADLKIAQKLEKLIGLKVLSYEAPLYEGSLLKKVVDTKEPVITPDIAWVLKSYTDKKYLQKLAKSAARLTKARWGMGVPLMAEDRIVGIIGCGSLEKLTDEDAKRLSNFGAQAGLAIEQDSKTKELKKRAKELEEANSLKDLFTDVMTHDLLNPVGIISGIAESALLDSPGDKELEMIKRNADRLIETIENASMLSKPKSEEELERKTLDLKEIIETIIKDSKPLFDSVEMNVENRIRIKMPVRANKIIGDVFLNLLTNVAKYARDDKVVVDAKQQGETYKVMVIDNGPGVADEYKKDIFNRFSRRAKGGVKGTGLGLTIAKRIVQMHNGRIWVEDNPKGGSIFSVEIPKV